VEGIGLDIIQLWQTVEAYFALDTARLTEPDMLARLLLQVLLLLGSAFFSGSETALFSLSRLDLQQLRRERNRHSETLHALLDQPRRLIISILCGNELINIAAAANMAGILYSLYGAERAGLINVLVMVPLLLLVGEVTPKTIAVSNPVRISSGVVAAPMNIWVRLVTPLRWVIRAIADRITTLIVGEETTKANILHVDEFRSLVEEVAKDGELNATERALIYNLLEANETEVVEIMTPRTRTQFLNAKMSPAELVEQFKVLRHSRVPVFRSHRDNLVGFLHAEDILRLVLKGTDLTGLKRKEILHPAVVVPLTKKVDEMFDFFQHHNARAAVVLNEFGGVEGFITMTDIINFIFGDLAGKSTAEALYRERDENVYEVPGDMKLTEFNDLTNFGIDDPRMTTIGGVAFRHLDHLPGVGDTVTVESTVLTVLEMDYHRVARLRVARGSALDEDTPGKSAERAEAQEQPGAEPEAATEEDGVADESTDTMHKEPDTAAESAAETTAVALMSIVQPPPERVVDEPAADGPTAGSLEQQRGEASTPHNEPATEEALPDPDTVESAEQNSAIAERTADESSAEETKSDEPLESPVNHGERTPKEEAKEHRPAPGEEQDEFEDEQEPASLDDRKDTALPEPSLPLSDASVPEDDEAPAVTAAHTTQDETAAPQNSGAGTCPDDTETNDETTPEGAVQRGG